MSDIYCGPISSLFECAAASFSVASSYLPPGALPGVLAGPSSIERLIPKGRLELGTGGLSYEEFIIGVYGRGLISSAEVLEDLQNSHLAIVSNVMSGGEERRVKVSDADSSDEELQELFRLATNLVEEEPPKITSYVKTAEAETSESSKLLNEISPRAEDLRRKRGKKTAILSVTRAGSILMLFLALGLLQHDPPLFVFFVTVAYIFFVITACIVLGISTVSQRGD